MSALLALTVGLLLVGRFVWLERRSSILERTLGHLVPGIESLGDAVESLLLSSRIGRARVLELEARLDKLEALVDELGGEI